jgi:hypothetical protein
MRSPVRASRVLSGNYLTQLSLSKAIGADSSAKSIFHPVFPLLTGVGKARSLLESSGPFAYALGCG